jgi:hypothetical protein
MIEMRNVKTRSWSQAHKDVQQGHGIRPPGHRYQDALGAFEQASRLDELRDFFECIAHAISTNQHSMRGTAQALHDESKGAMERSQTCVGTLTGY